MNFVRCRAASRGSPQIGASRAFEPVSTNLLKPGAQFCSVRPWIRIARVPGRAARREAGPRKSIQIDVQLDVQIDV
jgi:hypothetical protein